MTAFVRTTALLVVLGAWSAPCIAQETHEVRGRVVDADGRPVANVPLGTSWHFEREDASPRWRADARSSENPEVRSDVEGAFSAPLYFRGRPVALIALDLAGMRGGISIVDDDNVDKEVTVTLLPLIRARGAARVAEPALDDSALYVYVFDPRAPIAIVRAIESEREFAFALPPGPYEFSVAGKDLQCAKAQIELDAETPELDLGTIELLPTNLVKHYGKPPPPWTITEARGVSPDVELGDLKGKWVLVEFWAHW